MAKRKNTRPGKKKLYTYERYEDMSAIRKLERKLDRVNHIMELIRTIVPVALLILNCVILAKIFGLI